MRKLHSFDILRKYDNRTRNKNIASLGTCTCDCMLHTDRHDGFWWWMSWQFKICENTAFHWPIFSHIGQNFRIRASGNQSSRIFYAEKFPRVYYQIDDQPAWDILYPGILKLSSLDNLCKSRCDSGM